MAVSVGVMVLLTEPTVGNTGIPVLGINTGRLGFLAINYSDVDEALKEVMERNEREGASEDTDGFHRTF